MRVKVFLGVYCLCACFLLYALGAASFKYQLFPATYLNVAFIAFDAWEEKANAEKKYIVSSLSQRDVLKSTQVKWNRSEAFNGYTLMAFKCKSSAALIDMSGQVVHEWSLPFRSAFQDTSHIKAPLSEGLIIWYAGKVFPNGDLLVSYKAEGDTPYGYGLVKMDKDSNLIWAYSDYVHHTFYVSPENGHIYALTHSFTSKPIKGFENIEYPTLADTVVELSADGKLIRQVSVFDAFHKSGLKRADLGGRTDHWDFTHANFVMRLEPSIAPAFPMLKAGQLILSLRELNMLAVLDLDTQSIVATYIGGWRKQHHSQFLPNGNIIMFDNRSLRTSEEKETSRVIEYNPRMDRIDWSYGEKIKQRFYSRTNGMVQSLPNGNVMITSTIQSKIFEITRDGRKVWEIGFPDDASLDSKLKKLQKHPSIVFAVRHSAEELPFVTEKGK